MEARGALAAPAVDAVLEHDVHEPLVVLAPHHLDVAGHPVALGAVHGWVQEEGLRLVRGRAAQRTWERHGIGQAGR